MERDNMAIKAVLIGINYKKTQYQLYGCANDVQGVKNKLRADGIKDITVLSDAIKGASSPSASNIISALTTAVATAKEGDTLFVHYSGHGTEIKDFNHEEADGNDSAIVAVNRGTIETIIDDKLKAILANTKGVKVVGLFDSCDSGTIVDLPYSTEQATETSQLKNQKFTEMVFVSGCLDPQTSAEIQTTSGPGGALTKAWMANYGHDNGTIEFFNDCLGNEASKKEVGNKLNKWMNTYQLTQTVNVNWGGTLKTAATAAPVTPAHEQTSLLNTLLAKIESLHDKIEEHSPFKSKKSSKVEKHSPFKYEKSSNVKPLIMSTLPKPQIPRTHSTEAKKQKELGKREKLEQPERKSHKRKAANL